MRSQCASLPFADDALAKSCGGQHILDVKGSKVERHQHTNTPTHQHQHTNVSILDKHQERSELSVWCGRQNCQSMLTTCTINALASSENAKSKGTHNTTHICLLVSKQCPVDVSADPNQIHV